MRGRAVALLALAAIIAAVPLVASSCREATQVRLELETDVGCDAVTAGPGVEIHVAGSLEELRGDGAAPSAVTNQCEGAGRIGSLVLVPSGADTDRVVVEARLPLVPGAACVEGMGCIVARRSLKYLPHTKLALPIRLRGVCANVACPETETCIEGECRSAEVSLALCSDGVCDEDTVGVPEGGLPDGGRDAGPDASCGPFPRVQCGATCVDTSKDPANCGACGVDCRQGECTGGLCRLVPAMFLGASQGDRGCLAVDPGTATLYWTSNRGDAGHVYRVPRAGGTATAADPMNNFLYVAGGIGAGGGKLAVGARVTPVQPAPTGRIFESTPPGALTGTIYNGSSIAIPSVARDATDICTIDELGDAGAATIVCNGAARGGIPTLASNASIAVSNGVWAAVSPVGANNVFAGPTGPGAISGAPIAGAVGIAALPGTRTFYVAAGPSAWRVEVPSGAPEAGVSWPTTDAVGVAVDPQLQPWVLERPSNMTGRAARLEADGGVTRRPPITVPSTVTPLCLAADDQALYFLSGGVPYKIAK